MKTIYLAVGVPEGSQVCCVEIMPSDGFGIDMENDITAVDFRIIEAGEPVAWMYKTPQTLPGGFHICKGDPRKNPESFVNITAVTPLYTIPQPSPDVQAEIAELREQLEEICHAYVLANTEIFSLKSQLEQSRAVAPQVVSPLKRDGIPTFYVSADYPLIPITHRLCDSDIPVWCKNPKDGLEVMRHMVAGRANTISTPPEAKGLAVGENREWLAREMEVAADMVDNASACSRFERQNAMSCAANTLRTLAADVRTHGSVSAFAARPQASEPMGEKAADETAWLVEVSSAGPAYLRRQEDGILGWTVDHASAIRFARREDAETYIELEGLTAAKAVEHMWCATSDKPEQALEVDEFQHKEPSLTIPTNGVK